MQVFLELILDLRTGYLIFWYQTDSLNDKISRIRVKIDLSGEPEYIDTLHRFQGFKSVTIEKVTSVIMSCSNKQCALATFHLVKQCQSHPRHFIFNQYFQYFSVNGQISDCLEAYDSHITYKAWLDESSPSSYRHV